MTKEELRSKILELEEAMREEDSRSALAKPSDELTKELEEILYDELEGVTVKIVTERIVNKHDIDVDLLITEYMENGDLEKSFEIAAEDCDWKMEITKRILK